MVDPAAVAAVAATVAAVAAAAAAVSVDRVLIRVKNRVWARAPGIDEALRANTRRRDSRGMPKAGPKRHRGGMMHRAHLLRMAYVKASSRPAEKEEEEEGEAPPRPLPLPPSPVAVSPPPPERRMRASSGSAARERSWARVAAGRYPESVASSMSEEERVAVVTVGRRAK